MPETETIISFHVTIQGDLPAALGRRDEITETLNERLGIRVALATNEGRNVYLADAGVHPGIVRAEARRRAR
jgi:hypothetical protein